jgi:8-oxo-dGTP pyrophosphatase MutT (NUDIX family)
MIKPWELVKTETVEKNPYLELTRDTLKRSDGKIIEEYYAVKRKDWVGIVALTPEGEVPLVYQFRNGVKEMLWALPAGHVEKGQLPLEAAKRELLEETGFEAEEWVELGVFAQSPAVSSDRGHIFLAKKARKIQEQSLDENEEIEVKSFSLEDLKNSLLKKDRFIIESTMVLAILLAWEEMKS